MNPDRLMPSSSTHAESGPSLGSTQAGHGAVRSTEEGAGSETAGGSALGPVHSISCPSTQAQWWRPSGSATNDRMPVAQRQYATPVVVFCCVSQLSGLVCSFWTGSPITAPSCWRRKANPSTNRGRVSSVGGSGAAGTTGGAAAGLVAGTATPGSTTGTLGGSGVGSGAPAGTGVGTAERRGAPLGGVGGR